VTGLRYGGQRNRGSVLSKCKIYFCCALHPDKFRRPLGLPFTGYGGLLRSS
jgi:hypothetical protein